MKICSPQLGLDPKSYLGGEVHDYFVIKNLAKSGHKIFVYLPKNRSHEKHKNVFVEYAPIKHIPAIMFNLIIIPYLFKTYKREKFDILRIHNPYFLGLGAQVFKLFHPNVPVITTFHLVEENPLYDLINKFTVRKYDKIVCVSHYLKNWLVAKYHVDEKKITVIYNGVDPSLKPKIINQTLVKKYDLENKFTILFMGLLIPRKNPMFLLEVFRQLKKEIGNIALVISGVGPSKYQMDDFIKKHQLNDAHLIDPVYGKQKVDIFNLCDVFTLPSLNEGFGLVVAEAMACAKPVIVTANSSLSELVTDGKEGYLLNLNPHEWVSKIKALIVDNKLRKIVGTNGKNKVESQFNWKGFSQKYENVINNMINEKISRQ